MCTDQDDKSIYNSYQSGSTMCQRKYVHLREIAFDLSIIIIRATSHDRENIILHVRTYI